MCIICVLDKGAYITDTEFHNCWNRNPDGGGYVFVDETNQLSVKKFMKKDEMHAGFKEDFEKHEKQTPFILHFRIGTDGSKCLDNCHPFMVNQNLAMVHNGVITEYRPLTKADDRSDTRVFNETVLAKMPKNFLKNPGTVDLLEKFLRPSKMAFLDNRKNVYILNQQMGEFDKDQGGDRWFSNTSFKEARHVYSGGSVVPYSNWGGSTKIAPTKKRCETCWEEVPEWKYSYATKQCVECRKKVDIKPQPGTVRIYNHKLEVTEVFEGDVFLGYEMSKCRAEIPCPGYVNHRLVICRHWPMINGSPNWALIPDDYKDRYQAIIAQWWDLMHTHNVEPRTNKSLHSMTEAEYMEGELYSI